MSLKGLLKLSMMLIGSFFSIFVMAETSNMLSAWNNTKVKLNIIHFVKEITNPQSKNFIPISKRIVVFDNDGTLWVEKPLYIQLYFALEILSKKIKDKPGLVDSKIQQILLKKHFDKLNHRDLKKIIALTHSNISLNRFNSMAKTWLMHTNHPQLNCALLNLAYHPMIQLINYLKKNQFKVFIVTGGGIDFVRSISMDVYGIPPEQVIGSKMALKMVIDDQGFFEFIKLGKFERLNDKQIKVKSIAEIIGQRPVMAFGNSDGDFEMLRYTSNHQPSLAALVWHTDSTREYAYDRHSSIGKLDKALDYARKNNWLLIDMKRDWKTIFKNKQCKFKSNF